MPLEELLASLSGDIVQECGASSLESQGVELGKQEFGRCV